MTMNGFDCYNGQKNLNIAAMPCDFVISKATQGAGFVDSECDKVIQQCIRLHKKWGFYHYVGGGNAVAEANHFVDSCKNYFTHGIPCVDWEQVQNSAWGDLNYLRAVIAQIIKRTGIPPLLYASHDYYPWEVAKQFNCGTWVAQYGDMNPTGYQAHPWNENAYGCVIRQYSDKGRISGYNGDLDLDIAYITPAQWDKYANPHGEHRAAPAPKPKPFDVAQAARDVVAGKYGDGRERVRRLGSHYNIVQQYVNTLYKMANDTIRGNYGNGETRRRLLGENYDAVMTLVNQIMR